MGCRGPRGGPSQRPCPQVEYVFTDKTGTLTENNMEFRECCVEGHVYVPHAVCNGQVLPDAAMDMIDASPDASGREREELFFRALCLCHTIQVKDDDEVDGPRKSPDSGKRCVYISSSPDEVALVEGIQRYGGCGVDPPGGVLGLPCAWGVTWGQRPSGHCLCARRWIPLDPGGRGSLLNTWWQ